MTGLNAGPKSDLRNGTSQELRGEEEARTAQTPTASGPPGIAPITWSVLGKFFGVPLLIIGTVVGGAIVVVLLFGGPAGPEQRTIQDLLQALESNSGERSAGILLPREKELWQTALELSKRLEKKSVELTTEELTATAQRLASMVTVDLGHLDRVPAFGDDLAQQRALRSKRFEFLLHALGRTECDEAVGPLIAVVESGREPYAAVAMQKLGSLHALPAARNAVEPILEVMASSREPVTLLTACTVLSVLARSEDGHVRNALSAIQLSNEGEVAWSAALALARLGWADGKSTLLDLLDRSYWESGERYQVTDEGGNVKRYPMPPQRIDEWLTASVDATSNLDDEDLWAMIDRLKSDRSPAVRGVAARAIERRAKRRASP